MHRLEINLIQKNMEQLIIYGQLLLNFPRSWMWNCVVLVSCVVLQKSCWSFHIQMLTQSIYSVILYVRLSFQGGRDTHIWGYEWVGGNGDGGMGCIQNRIGVCSVRHWRLSVLTFTPLLRSLKRASVVIHLVRVAGIRNSGSHVTYSFRHAGACCQG